MVSLIQTYPLLDRGVPMEEINNEANARHQVTIAETEEYFDCDEQQAVLNAMVALGRKGIPSGCHGGGCGICKIKIVRGGFRAKVMSREHISEQEEQNGIVLACRTYPCTDIRLQVLGKISKAVTGKSRRYGFV